MDLIRLILGDCISAVLLIRVILFLMAKIVMVFLLLFAPQIATFLPSLME
jgi:hypothetical protein